MTIYFLDKNGNTIYEDQHAAIWTSTRFRDAPGSLKPNYIKKCFTYCKGCPSEWAEGKVKLGIGKIEFAKD